MQLPFHKQSRGYGIFREHYKQFFVPCKFGHKDITDAISKMGESHQNKIYSTLAEEVGHSKLNRLK